MRRIPFARVALLLCVAIVANLQLATASPAAAPLRRIVALGDIHGDVEQLRAALIMAQLIDNATHAWIGGPKDKLVQVGDMLDRGPHDKQVMDEMRRVQKEAAAKGSEVVILMGNHELMNIRGQTHYVHPDVYEAFGGRHAHARAMSTEGEYGKFLRSLPVTHVDMRTLFVHAGLLPEYARRGLDAINAAAKEEVRQADDDPRLRRGDRDDVLGVHGAVWTRKLVTRAQQGSCQLVRETLDILGLERMVVGHTPQREGFLGDFCDSRLIVVDVGMSKWMYGNLAMLELTEVRPDVAAQTQIELREILPHTALQAPAADASNNDAPAATLEEELKRDPVRLQEIFDTARQAADWKEDL
jgi:folate-dependent phosphoribosylglycinamide formyltransferase PurN